VQNTCLKQHDPPGNGKWRGFAARESEKVLRLQVQRHCGVESDPMLTVGAIDSANGTDGLNPVEPGSET